MGERNANSEVQPCNIKCTFIHILIMNKYNLLHVSVQQPPVLCNLHLQPDLDVQQHLVLIALPVNVGAHLAYVHLQDTDDGLKLGQFEAVAGLCVSQ